MCLVPGSGGMEVGIGPLLDNSRWMFGLLLLRIGPAEGTLTSEALRFVVLTSEEMTKRNFDVFWMHSCNTSNN